MVKEPLQDERLLHAVMDTCSEAIYVFKTDGMILYCNEAAREENGYGEEIGTINILDIFPKFLCVRHHMITLLNPPMSKDREAFAYRRNQTCYPVRIQFVWQSIGQERLGILTARNISELRGAIKREKLLKEELKEADRIKNMFLANITHELRTPVNGMKGLVDVLAETTLTTQQRENVNIIRRCCVNMSNLINEVLDFTKVSADKLILEETEFDFQQFIKNTIAVHMTALSEKGLALQVNIGENVPATILGDELRLGQVLNNLMSNAIKFTSNGRITIEIVNTYEDEEDLELFFMIMDTGIGIAKEDMDKLFPRFSQIDGSITRKYGGTGLGLSISKKLIELMKGSIYVDSEVGKGSKFSFSARFHKGSNVSNLNKNEELSATKEDKTLSLKKLEILPEQRNAQMRVSTWNQKYISDNIENLTLCLELGIWEKAETYARLLREHLPEELAEERKQAFRLLLTVRKENYDLSMQQLKDLANMILQRGIG